MLINLPRTWIIKFHELIYVQLCNDDAIEIDFPNQIESLKEILIKTGIKQTYNWNFTGLFEMLLPYDPVCRSFGWSVGRSVIIS